MTITLTNATLRFWALAFIFIFSAVAAKAQAPVWQSVNHYGSGSSLEFVNKVKTDSQGNRYMVGMYKDSTRLGTNTFTSSQWLADMFIAKTDPNGNVIWAYHTNTTTIAFGADLAIDANGNCYITGHFRWDATFGPVSFLDSVQLRPRVMFLTKIDASGNFAWTLIEQNVLSAGTSLTTDAAGNVILAGFYGSNPPGSGNPGFNFAGLSGPAATPWYANNLFTAKINPQGQGQWIRVITTTGPQDIYHNAFQPTGKSLYGGSSTETDAAGNIYMSTSFVAPNVTAGSQTFTYPTNSDTTYRVLLVKYDSNGTQQWAKAWSGTRDVSLSEMIPDAAGNVYVTGIVKGLATIDGTPVQGGKMSSYLARFTTQGTLDWVRTISGTEKVQVMGMAIDQSGFAYTAGGHTGSVTLNGQTSIAPANGESGWIVKYAPNGQISWTLTPSNCGFTNLDILPNGQLLAALAFNGQVTLGTNTYTSIGQADFLLATLSPTIVSGIGEPTEQKSQILLYPNPSNGTFSIQAQRISSVRVLNALGQVVHHKNTSPVSTSATIILPELPNGLYQVQVVSEGKIHTKQLVLQR